MEIIIDKEKCIGCGTCVALCPKAFEMDEDGKAKAKKLTNEKIDCIQEAVDNCPTGAITINNR
ncbi:MAG: ferredoxin [bacterium]|nr:ferredoxin [bacterium]